MTVLEDRIAMAESDNTSMLDAQLASATHLSGPLARFSPVLERP
jgi:hypothetical protein